MQLARWSRLDDRTNAPERRGQAKYDINRLTAVEQNF